MSLGFIIIGAQKSATSFVHACLREHPSIAMPPEETPCFESPDYENGAAEILKGKAANAGRKLFGIKRPSYLGKPEIAGRIHEHCPDAKLLVILRNPIERAISAYFHYIKNRFLPFIDLTSGMEQVLAGELKEYPAAREVLEYGFYSKHLRSYLEMFQRDQICILLHDDIIADRAGSMRRIYRFLGVDENYAPHSINSRPQAVFYQPLRLRLHVFINRLDFTFSVFRQRLAPRGVNSLPRLVARVLKALDRRILARFLKNPRPKLGESLRLRLGDLYRKDIENLERLIGRDLSAWKTPASRDGNKSLGKIGPVFFSWPEENPHPSH